jgi:hypothetical protein
MHNTQPLNQPEQASRFTINYQIFSHNSPSILVPGLHLGVAQPQLVGQLHAILNAQVLLPFERLLQRLQLIVGECCARLALLFTQTSCAVQAHAALYTVAILVLAAYEWNEWKQK